MINMEYKPGAIASIYYFRKQRKFCLTHSHGEPEKVMELIQKEKLLASNKIIEDKKDTFLELTKELALHKGCIANFKTVKKSLQERIKPDNYNNHNSGFDLDWDVDIEMVQVLTQEISSDTTMMGVLEKKIEQLTSDMFVQQDKKEL